MSDHASNGKFAPGNSAHKGNYPFKVHRDQFRKDIFEAVLSLQKPIATLKSEIEDPGATRWQYIVAKNISKNNYKFIQWLFEMAIGRPAQSVEVKDPTSLTRDLVIHKLNGDKEVLKAE